MPKVAARCPYRRELFPNTEYLYCTCGLSEEVVFCDKKCENTDWKPLKFTVPKYIKSALICGCKRNNPKAGPYCDGSHSVVNLDW